MEDGGWCGDEACVVGGGSHVANRADRVVHRMSAITGRGYESGTTRRAAHEPIRRTSSSSPDPPDVRCRMIRRTFVIADPSRVLPSPIRRTFRHHTVRRTFVRHDGVVPLS
jgi:hypothetical protein